MNSYYNLSPLNWPFCTCLSDTHGALTQLDRPTPSSSVIFAVSATALSSSDTALAAAAVDCCIDCCINVSASDVADGVGEGGSRTGDDGGKAWGGGEAVCRTSGAVEATGA